MMVYLFGFDSCYSATITPLLNLENNSFIISFFFCVVVEKTYSVAVLLACAGNARKGNLVVEMEYLVCEHDGKQCVHDKPFSYSVSMPIILPRENNGVDHLTVDFIRW